MLRTNQLTADQIAIMFSVDASTVRRWATRTRHHDPCPHTKDRCGRLRFAPDLVDKWLAETGVGKRSRAQQQQPTPAPLVSLMEAVQWRPEQVKGHDADRDLVAMHRTVATALHVCITSDELPDPPDAATLDTEAGRNVAIDFLMALPDRPADQWKRIAADAIAKAGDARLMDAIYG